MRTEILRCRFYLSTALILILWLGLAVLSAQAVVVGDTDGDGALDGADNCMFIANPDQRDTDGDQYGNLCDGDLNNDGATNTLDLNLYKLAHRSRVGDPNYNPDADFNGDGAINTIDLNLYKGLHRKPPGPSGLRSYRLYGIDFSPYGAGQDPNLGAVMSEAELTAKMEIVKPYTTWIRTFGSTQGLEPSGAIAHRLGLKAALGAWISRNLVANEIEIQSIIRAGQAGEADLLLVGSEVLLRGDVSPDQLLAYINRVKSQVPGIAVSYADTYTEILAHPAIIAAVDEVWVNYYPYWQGIAIENAVAAIHGWHQQLVAAANGKPVIVSEAGWPSGGNTIGEAVPSATNANLFFLNFVSWARANAVPFYYFEAFNEPWKVAYEGPQGAHWGVWDEFGNLKPGMERVFNAETMADNWSATAIPGGPGIPTIEFIQVPPYASFEDLKGQVWHVDPASYKVAVYIYINGWWTKPYWSSPLTTIQRDGRWVCDVSVLQQAA